jgi:SAM-dependent methyltransferase
VTARARKSINPRLSASRQAWASKPVLRRVYEDYYRRMAEYLASGATVEIGSGMGWLKSHLPGAVTTDIQMAPWLDLVADAHRLPFGRACFANLVLFDVLHHLAEPRLFFAEACRVLRPGGRIILLEPGISPVSGPFYRLFHDEPVDMSADPIGGLRLSDGADPYHANQAIASLLVGRHRRRFCVAFPELRFVSVRWISLLAYPLSGGLRPWSLIPAAAAGPLIGLERRLEPLLGRFCGFRVLAVLERD